MTLRLRPSFGGSLAIAGLLALVPATLRADDGAPYPGPLQAPPPPSPAPQGPQAPRLRTPEELRELVGPIALYPDVVLSSLLPASAYPLDVVQAARKLRQRRAGDTTPLADPGWDPSVAALVQFPDVVLWLDENLEWLDQLGAAVAQQPADVLAAIQRFREDAKAAGTLATDEHQRVSTEELPPPEDAPPGTGPARVICIRPVEPTVVYVPVYDPVVVLQPVPVYEPAYPIFSWSYGCAFDAYGPWAWHDLGWGWPSNGGWWGRGVYVHNRPCYPERTWRTHSSHGDRGTSEWRPSAEHGAYAPRRRSGDVTTPGRPSWSEGAPFARGADRGARGAGDAIVRTGDVHRPAPTAPMLPRWNGASGASGAGAPTGTVAGSGPSAYAPRTGSSPSDGRLLGGTTDGATRRGPEFRWDRKTAGSRGAAPAPTISTAPSLPTAAPSTPTAAPRSEPRMHWFPRSTSGNGSAPSLAPRTLPQPRAWQPASSAGLPTVPSATPTPDRRGWAKSTPTWTHPSAPAPTFTAPKPRPSPTFSAPNPTFSAPTPRAGSSDRAPSGFGRRGSGTDVPPPPPPRRMPK